jgi:solute carrier family 35 protein F5
LAQEFVWPDEKTFAFLLLNGFLGSMVSDVLWALAVVMTSPFAASVGLALTIPLGWLADFIFHKNSSSSSAFLLLLN